MKDGDKVIQLKDVELLQKCIYNANQLRLLSQKKLCPVNALQQYMSYRGNLPGPSFVSFTNEPITLSRFRSVFHDILAFCNMSKTKYKLHSFRIGVCTHAFMKGISEDKIMQMGRWKSRAY